MITPEEKAIEVSKDSRINTNLGMIITLIGCVAIIVGFYFTNVKGEINSKADDSRVDSLEIKFERNGEMEQDMFFLLIKYIEINNPDIDIEYFKHKYKIPGDSRESKNYKPKGDLK